MNDMLENSDTLSLIRACLSGETMEWAKPTLRVASNRAGVLLLESAEYVHQEIREFVQHCARAADVQEYAAASFGMEYVLGAYVMGAARLKRRDFASEVMDLPAEWIVAVIGATSMVFMHTRFGYSCGTAPNETILTLLSVGQASAIDQVRETSEATLKQISAPPRTYPPR